MFNVGALQRDRHVLSRASASDGCLGECNELERSNGAVYIVGERFNPRVLGIGICVRVGLSRETAHIQITNANLVCCTH